MARPPNHVELTFHLSQILDGLLLSDASLQRRGNCQTACLRLMQSPKRRGWLESLAVDLQALGVITRLSLVHRRPTPLDGRMLPGGPYDLLRTLNYAEFVGLHKRWYPHGRKVVPLDIQLTPTALCHWFCGDGRGGDSKGTLGFCTDGFLPEDVQRLVNRLRIDVGVESTMTFNQRRHPQILVGRRAQAVKVRDAIAQLLPECCRYKFDHVRPLPETGRGRRLSLATKTAILHAKGSGLAMRTIALHNGVSTSKVWKLWRT